MKYIIDIPIELLLKDDGYSFSDGNSYCITGDLSKLTPYTEPDRKAIEDEVWGFAREMISTSGHEVSEMWGCITNFGEVMHNTTYQEAKAKYDAWLKQKDEIHVGDEVVVNGTRAVVMKLDETGNIDRYFTSNGTTFGNISGFQNYEVTKTNRHFPEVAELLKRMRGEE